MSLLQEMQQHGLADCEFNRKLTGGKTVKYYLGNVLERNGEFEYISEYLFATKGSPDRYSKKIAMDWRGSTRDDWDEDQDGWWCDCTLVFDGGRKEIPKEDFDVLSKYLTVM